MVLVPQGGRQVLAALVLPPHLAVGQRGRGVAGGAGQRDVEQAGPRRCSLRASVVRLEVMSHERKLKVKNDLPSGGPAGRWQG